MHPVVKGKIASFYVIALFSITDGKMWGMEQCPKAKNFPV